MTKVCIIGAGVGGLSAGCFLQMNGYETEIFELNNSAGGLCTSWKRNGYTIDGCIHWWVGTNPNDPLYPILDALLDMKNFPRVTYEEFCSVEKDGKILRFFGDLDRFETELKTISPQDSKIIEEMIAGARKFASIRIPLPKARELMNVWDKLLIARKARALKKALQTWDIPIQEYMKRIQSPLIRKLLVSFTLHSRMFEFLMNAAWFHNKNASYPHGGAEELTARLVRRYESLGGKIHYNSPVAKIIVEEDCAKGIRLKNGSKHNSEYIISAADWRHTMCDLLEGRSTDESKFYCSEKCAPKLSQVYLSLGVARTFKDSFKPYVYIPLKKPLHIHDEEITDVGVTIHNFDPQAAPSGKTVLTMMIIVHDPEYWVQLRNENRAAYQTKKEEIAEHMIEELDSYFGSIKDNVEMVDVATPASFIRYTNNWNGAPGAWQDFSHSFHKPKKEIPGLKNFIMCGHWVSDDGGLSGAMQSGRDVAQILCRRDGKKFKRL
jgi:phytoene dehydrogenase-like protein